MTTAKSAEEIFAELDRADMQYLEVRTCVWLRAALASHTAYLLGKWPKDSTQNIHTDYAEGKKDGYNIGTRDARAILEAEITELTK